jgi:hypothetical protein
MIIYVSVSSQIVQDIKKNHDISKRILHFETDRTVAFHVNEHQTNNFVRAETHSYCKSLDSFILE